MEPWMRVQFALRRELFTAIRLLAGGLCSAAGMSLDASEDCKVCITEAMLIFMRRGYRSVRIEFGREENFRVRLEGLEKEGNGEPSVEEDISVALLEALVENLDMQKKDGVPQVISFGFGA